MLNRVAAKAEVGWDQKSPGSSPGGAIRDLLYITVRGSGGDFFCGWCVGVRGVEWLLYNCGCCAVDEEFQKYDWGLSPLLWTVLSHNLGFNA